MTQILKIYVMLYICNRLHLLEGRNSAGELVQLPSFESISQKAVLIWMENKAHHTPKFVEEECLDSLLAYIWRFEDSHAMYQVGAEVENNGFLLFGARCVKIHRRSCTILVWNSG
jgi:hypothetical protein